MNQVNFILKEYEKKGLGKVFFVCVNVGDAM